ncbi:exostosin-2-like [Sycon ciliatum]|uniref:exostosin-2-like n=1 Tax=Sycon ciliatum TaxID=27933 RepID=UPI0031F645B3
MFGSGRKPTGTGKATAQGHWNKGFGCIGSVGRGSPVRISMAVKIFVVAFFTCLTVCLSVTWILFKSGYFNADLPTVVVRDRQTGSSSASLRPLPRDCSIQKCFDLSRCHATRRLRVYVYPDTRFVDRRGSRVLDVASIEYLQMLDAVKASRFYEPNPEKACVFVPAVDTLNLLRTSLNNVSRALDSLKWFGNGTNHLLISMLFDVHQLTSLRAGYVMLAGAGFHPTSYRAGFDIAIPMVNPRTVKATLPSHDRLRQFTLIVSLTSAHQLAEQFPKLPITKDVLVLERCAPDSELTGGRSRFGDERKRCSASSQHSYPAVLLRGDFCILPPNPTTPVLVDAAKMACIPVVIKNSRVMPFRDGIDWTGASVEIYADQLSELPSILRAISMSKKEEMRQQVRTFFDRFFQSPGKVALAVLQTIEDRLATNAVNQHHFWNKVEPHATDGHGLQLNAPLLKVGSPHSLPLFMLHPARQTRHFTAVILSYDRFKTLVRVLKKIDPTPSLIKIIVVWNNQKNKPPPESAWPRLNTTLQVLQSRYNRLNNRFIPFKDIETDCILALDDDIEMVTPDELEFGFQVWKEFPDRLVGFPGRLHNYNTTVNRFQYTSQWGSELSMVLTGAAFHHKYYSYLYTYVMPKAIRHWVNKHMNCEDIAMNYLVAGFTGKPPIKATPKKRFRCERCSANESLWDGPGYFVERNLCLNNFTRLYGNKMPLREVEYRADPVLYLEDVPHHQQRFQQVGSL